MTPTQRLYSNVFMIFELLAGEVLKKWKKNRIFAGEVSTNAFLTFPRCMGITKQNDSHASWEGRNRELRHLSSENVDFCRSSDFCCCRFWSIWGRQTGIPAGSLKGNVKLIKNMWFFENRQNEKCCQNHWWEQDFEAKRLQQQITQFEPWRFSLDEDEIYVKIFTGLARERVT